jgi:mannose-6-phosphate isomerase-like protein (cupin superfamily)
MMEAAMRKTILGVFVGLLVVTAADTKPGSATYITAADVQATLKKAPENSATDQQVRVVDVGKANVAVGVVYRSVKATQSAVEHDSVTEVYQILEGSGTLTTGGEIVTAQGASATTRDSNGPSGPSMRGSALRNGASQRVGPGDIIVIPAGVGHIFTSIEGRSGDGIIKYVVVRVDPDRVLALK